MSDETIHEKELGGKLLASVSRSFYLTLKALPRELREPVSLAYLLARTADTIADTASVDAAVRLDCLSRYGALVDGNEGLCEDMEVRLAEVLHRDFCPMQTDEAERRLMERFRDALVWLRTMQDPALGAIRQVLKRIIRGQKLDIERFPADGSLRSLRTAEELREYTWLVAGCVGEFWTEMCAELLPSAFAPGAVLEDMRSRGAAFGRGLQLVNILRDLPEDLGDGRCYLPSEEWGREGLELGQIQRDGSVLMPVWRRWLEVCSESLHEGLLYVQQLADGRLRYATALPLLLGARTVARLRKATWADLAAGVKVSRMEVTLLLAEAAVACRSGEGIARLYTKLSSAS